MFFSGICKPNGYIFVKECPAFLLLPTIWEDKEAQYAAKKALKK